MLLLIILDQNQYNNNEPTIHTFFINNTLTIKRITPKHKDDRRFPIFFYSEVVYIQFPVSTKAYLAQITDGNRFLKVKF